MIEKENATEEEAYQIKKALYNMLQIINGLRLDIALNALSQTLCHTVFVTAQNEEKAFIRLHEIYIAAKNNLETVCEVYGKSK